MAVQHKAFEDLEGPEFVRSSDVEAVAEKVLALHGGIGGVPRLHTGGQVEAWNGAIGRWEVVPTPEEADFFAALGQAWIEPRDRHVSRVRIRREVLA